MEAFVPAAKKEREEERLAQGHLTPLPMGSRDKLVWRHMLSVPLLAGSGSLWEAAG